MFNSSSPSSHQAFLSAKERRDEELAKMERQRRLEEVLRQKRQASSQSESITDQEMDDIFGFLPKMVGGQEGQAPMGFEVREQTGCPDVIREGRGEG